MCGRYVLAQQAKAEKAFAVTRLRWFDRMSYNVAPAREVPVVRFADGEREGVMMRFGLVPAYLKGQVPKFATANARIETMETSPAYRASWTSSQRCIVPAEGFYEWQMIPDAPRQPWFIGLANQEVMPMAALWERSVRSDGTVIESFAIITMPANAQRRMPAILRMADVATWLTGTPEAARSGLREFPADQLRAYTVSARVTSPKNDDPSLIDEITLVPKPASLF
jgi:putative SOS response-associated peptidase YedK